MYLLWGNKNCLFVPKELEPLSREFALHSNIMAPAIEQIAHIDTNSKTIPSQEINSITPRQSCMPGKKV
jgi:hypothetical protein